MIIGFAAFLPFVITDLRNRTINAKYSLAAGMVMLIYRFLIRPILVGQFDSSCFWMNLGQMVISESIALIIVLFAVWGRGIGVGDGVMICYLATFLTPADLMINLGISMFLLFVYGLILLVVFHVNGKKKIPAAPFLFLGTGTVCLLEYVLGR